MSPNPIRPDISYLITHGRQTKQEWIRFSAQSALMAMEYHKEVREIMRKSL